MKKKCHPDCDGSADSGGVTPWGESISIPCPECERANTDPPMRLSQVKAIGESSPKTWDDYERGCLATFGGGYQTDAERDVFHHGISTVFNLLRAEFPNACNPDHRGKAWWQKIAEAKQEERDKARMILVRVVAAAMTSQRENTKEWMAYMAERMNEAMAFLGQTRRVGVTSRGEFEVTE